MSIFCVSPSLVDGSCLVHSLRQHVCVTVTTSHSLLFCACTSEGFLLVCVSWIRLEVSLQLKMTMVKYHVCMIKQ